jgi:hypothetical protein
MLMKFFIFSVKISVRTFDPFQASDITGPFRDLLPTIKASVILDGSAVF